MDDKTFNVLFGYRMLQLRELPLDAMSDAEVQAALTAIAVS